MSTLQFAPQTFALQTPNQREAWQNICAFLTDTVPDNWSEYEDEGYSLQQIETVANQISSAIAYGHKTLSISRAVSARIIRLAAEDLCWEHDTDDNIRHADDAKERGYWRHVANVQAICADIVQQLKDA